MSLSLIAVFIPILLMGGIVGRYFREFAVTLSVAILISLMLSLTMTPMMCSRLLLPASERRHGRLYAWSERGFERLRRGYEKSLAWVLTHGILMMLILLAVVCLNVYLYVIIPKGFFPTQDTGRLIGFIQADQSISFQAMQPKLASFIDIVRADPAVENVVAFTGGAQRNTGRMFVQLKPLAERKESADKIIARLRIKLANEPGANLFLNPVQDIRVGGRQANATYQYTLQADDLDELRTWEPRIRAALSRLPQLVDVNTDQQDKGLQTSLVIDRDAAARLGVSPRLDRHHPERRVRPATGIDDLFGAQPVPRRDGGGARILAVARRARRRLRQHAKRRAGAAVGDRSLRPDQHRAGRQSPVAVRRFDDLVQSPRRNVARPGDGRHRQGARRARGSRRRYAAASREPRRRSRLLSTASPG